MIYTEKHYRESRLAAIRAHGNQAYDDIFPYEKHLEDVIAVLKRFGLDGKYIVAGWLHDAIEDGALSYNKIKQHFGIEVAEIVYCVTDELGRNRDERKSKTLPKIASNPDAVIVKLADRIANLEHGGLSTMYKKEYKAFRDALFTNDRVAAPMWEHLDKLVHGEQVVA